MKDIIESINSSIDVRRESLYSIHPETAKQVVVSNLEPILKDIEAAKALLEDKEFILWARENKIKSLRKHGLEVEFHDSAFYESHPVSEGNPENAEGFDLDIDPDFNIEDVSDDDLYHSAN